ncbi:hypothetical protein DRO37_00715 [Candidatus Bathyarchaeota archaeon]|nr:MAG: hypothetical protein DRO37_00715 [Candidatus Bathyarchaeota archaeon]
MGMSSNIYEHYMLREILEEPGALRRTIDLERGRIRSVANRVVAENYEMIYITGSGTSYHAGLASQYALSNLSGLTASTLPASEFDRWVPRRFSRRTLLIAISQSGESSDILEAADAASERGIPILAVTNTPGSSLAEKADFQIFPRSGRENAVPATKTYVTQLMSLFMLSLELAMRRVGNDELSDFRERLYMAPQAAECTLKSLISKVREASRRFKDLNVIFLLGSGSNFATALEGALKLKETCNVFSEGFATGEFLHGPLRLVNEGTLVIMMATPDEIESIVELNRSLKGFGAFTMLISEGTPKVTRLSNEVDEIFTVSSGMPRIFSPLLYVLPLQVFAYYSSVIRGFNPDRPEKLRKVVR